MANIKDLINAVKASDSWESFKALVNELEPDKEVQPGYIVDKEKEPLQLTEFDMKLKKALNWNPKENKQ